MDDEAQATVSNRRAVLAALLQILDARSLEALFAGPPAEAALLFDVLEEAAKGVQSSYYWEICRTARRRQLTAEFVVDRAAVLLASIHERRKWDLYRLLDVPPLSTFDVIQQRFRELAKVEHPDLGGDGMRFRRLKEAYDVLKDDGRRAEYEAFWVRALGPFERTRVQLPAMSLPPVPPAPVSETTTAPAMATEVTGEVPLDAPVEPMPVSDAVAAEALEADVTPVEPIAESPDAFAATDVSAAPDAPDDVSARLRRVFQLFRTWDERVFPTAAADGAVEPGRVIRLAAGLQVAARGVPDDVEQRRARVDDLLEQFVHVRAQLDAVARLKHQFPADAR